jgi:hypothetical protein
VRRDGQRFVGEICGFGTASGTRLVVGRWVDSPFGAFADVMVEHAGGHRVLVAPSREVGAYVAAVYAFDEVVVTPVTTLRGPDRLRVDGGPLHAEIGIGRRDALGWVLRAVPRHVATTPAWAVVVDPVARLVLRGVRTRGSTAGGIESYGATDRHRVDRVEATWAGAALGALAEVHPPVRFGFRSAPRRPSIVALTTTVRVR